MEKIERLQKINEKLQVVSQVKLRKILRNLENEIILSH